MQNFNVDSSSDGRADIALLSRHQEELAGA